MPGVRLELTTYRLPSHFGFRRHVARHVRGLDYPFTMAPGSRPDRQVPPV